MIRQFLVMDIAFALMPVWSKKKLGFDPMLLTGLILSLIAGLVPLTMAGNFLAIFTTPSTVKTIIILLIGMLGTLMKHYDILTQVVDSLKQLISSQKAIITVLSAIIGMAIISSSQQICGKALFRYGLHLYGHG